MRRRRTLPPPAPAFFSFPPFHRDRARRTLGDCTQSGGPMNVQTFLDQMGINYRLSTHPTAYTAQDLAAAEHVPGKRVVKPVVVRADGRFVMCVLPAPYKVDLEELKDQIEAREVQLVEE